MCLCVPKITKKRVYTEGSFFFQKLEGITHVDFVGWTNLRTVTLR
jgi:hypothetical protein